MTAWIAERYDELDSKGTLEVGKIADLMILDKDPLNVEPTVIKVIKVVETIKNGRTVFPAPGDYNKTAPKAPETAGLARIRRAHVCDMSEVNQAAGKECTIVSIHGNPIVRKNLRQ